MAPADNHWPWRNDVAAISASGQLIGGGRPGILRFEKNLMHAAGREPKPARDYFFSASDLNEMPSCIAIFLMVSGFRPVAFTASSSDFEARASSINCRCSLNDQADFRAIQECASAIRTKPPSGVYLLGDFAGGGSGPGNLSGASIEIQIRQFRNKCRALS